MFPDLSYFLHFIFGIAPDNAFAVVKTFGLFLGLSFIASGYMLYLELKRKEAKGELIGIIENVTIYKPITWSEIFAQCLFYFIVGFKLLFVINHFGDFKKDPASIVFSSKGNIIGGLLLGLFALLYMYYKMRQQKDKEPKIVQQTIYPHQRVYEITTYAAVSGIIGSRLFSVLENFSDFLKDPIGAVFSGSGLTIYGGLILAFFVVSWFMRKKQMPFLHMVDAIAPTLMIGYAVGRMGCHLSGDGDWGIINEAPKPSWFILPDSWWAFSYPHNVLNEGQNIAGCTWAYCSELVPPVFPTPLYESILAFMITFILWQLRKKINIPGLLFFIYCLLNGVERFFIEAIRVNPRYDLFGFHPSMAQVIAMGLVLIGISGSIYLVNNSKK